MVDGPGLGLKPRRTAQLTSRSAFLRLRQAQLFAGAVIGRLDERGRGASL